MLLQVTPLASMVETARGGLECLYDPQPLVVAAQTVSCDEAALDPRFFAAQVLSLLLSLLLRLLLRFYCSV